MQREESKKTVLRNVVTIQAWDGDWQMSEDLTIKVDLGMSVSSFIQYVGTLRGVSPHRIKVRLPNGKVVPKDRLQWALRRHGIQNDSKIRVEPTRPGGWQWYDEEYYEKKLCDEVLDVLRGRRGEAIEIQELRKLVTYPPCYKASFRVFLRRFPDQLRLRSDITTNKIYVCINEGLQLLSYERIPQELGKIKQYIPPPDEYWEDFKDVDSINPVESELVLPTLNYRIGIMGGDGFASGTSVQGTCPFVVVLVDGKYVGHSKSKLGTRCPRYHDTSLIVPFPYNTDFKKSHSLRVEIWNLDMSKHEVTCCQFCAIEGADLKDFFEPELVGDYYKTFAVVSTEAEEERRAEAERKYEEAEAKIAENEIRMMEAEDERKEALDALFEADRLKEEQKRKEDEELYGTNKAIESQVENGIEDDDDDELYGLNGQPKKKTPEERARQTLTVKLSKLNGFVHLRGSKNIFQLKVRGAFELWSHESDDSEDVNPFIIVLWNGLDVGNTTLRKLTRWPSWDDAIFDIPCPGNMEVNQCFLEVQVWNRSQGIEKYLMSSFQMTARPLKEYILNDPDYATRRTFELKPPDEEIINEDGEVTKVKSKQKGGFISLLAGPIGVPENNLTHYQIEINVGTAMARTEVYCVLFWNSVEFGRTDNAPSVTEKVSKKIEKVTWVWKKNKFTFSLTEKEKLSKGELKIDCYDPTTKGLQSFFGSIIVDKEELTEFLGQDFAQIRSYTMRKDPKRNDKEQRINRGTLSLRGGEYGSRTETERLIEIRACTALHGDVTEGKTPPMCYVDAFWVTSGVSVKVGQTKPKPNDLNPFWEVTDDRWAIPKDCKPSGLYYSNVVLYFEVWEGLPEEDPADKVLLGVCFITQSELQDFVESKRYAELEIALKSPADAKFKVKKAADNQQKVRKDQTMRIGGYLHISTPGNVDKTPFIHHEKEDTKINDYLDTYIDRKGAANLFEWSNREKYRDKL